jgi:hypothetical protein
MFASIFKLLPLLFWIIVWVAAGLLIVTHVFHLPRRERTIVGVALGLVMETWTGNLLAHFLPVDLSFWLGALLPLGFGLVCALPLSRKKIIDAFSVSIPQLLGLLALFWIYYSINRGINLFDDFQNLPLVSVLASGSIPPHFPLDPNVVFGFHYQLLLFGAQLTRIGHILAWNALDMARALSLVLSFFLMVLFVWRMTRSPLVGLFGGIFSLFASGTRWLFLLLPVEVVQAVSAHVTLIGSANQIAPNLSAALTSPWNIDGGGPIAFPFAFINGLASPLTLAMSATSALNFVTIMLLLMLSRRWRDARGGVVMVILLASLAFIAEYDYVVLFPALVLAWIVYCIIKRSLQWPRSLTRWAVALAVSAVFVAFQGGVLTQIIEGFLVRVGGGQSQASYHSFTFSLVWPPSLISAHLGALRLNDPYQLLAALLELGPLVLALPLVIFWGIKMARAQHWFEAAFVAWIVPGILTSVVQYSGTAGISANSRLLSMLLLPSLIFAVPLAWTWIKPRSQRLKQVVIGLGFVTIFGGLMIFGVELIAAQKPLLPPWINELDAKIYRQYWDQLPSDALVFDPVSTRSVIVFGRFTNSSVDWFANKPEWQALTKNPDPYALRAAGYDFAYFGADDLDSLSPQLQTALQSGCVKLVKQVDGFRNATNFHKDFRRLLDLRQCK